MVSRFYQRYQALWNYIISKLNSINGFYYLIFGFHWNNRRRFVSTYFTFYEFNRLSLSFSPLDLVSMGFMESFFVKMTFHVFLALRVVEMKRGQHKKHPPQSNLDSGRFPSFPSTAWLLTAFQFKRNNFIIVLIWWDGAFLALLSFTEFHPNVYCDLTARTTKLTFVLVRSDPFLSLSLQLEPIRVIFINSKLCLASMGYTN